MALLRLGPEAYGAGIRGELRERAGRSVSRGAFYTTLDRLERKGFVRWEERRPDDSRRSAPLRRFEVTDDGLAALRASRRALQALSRGLDDVLEGA